MKNVGVISLLGVLSLLVFYRKAPTIFSLGNIFENTQAENQWDWVSLTKVLLLVISAATLIESSFMPNRYIVLNNLSARGKL